MHQKLQIKRWDRYTGGCNQPRDSKSCGAKATSANNSCQEQRSLLLVWSAHVFVLPPLDNTLIEHTLVPKTVKGLPIWYKSIV